MTNTYNIIENNITYSVTEWSNGDKFWYLNGKFHRVNGPAIEYTDGYKAWYFHGTHISCKNLKEFNKQIKLLSIS